MATRKKTTAKKTTKTTAKKATKTTKKATKTTTKATAPSASDWREQSIDRMRTLIFQADPDMIEEQKWRKPSNNMVGVPVWSHDGIVCTGEKYKAAIKLTFAHGASLPDPARLFTSSLDGNMRRAIDIPEGGTIDAVAFKALIRAAVARNIAAKAGR